MKAVPRSALTLSIAAATGAAVASVTTLLWSGAFPSPAGAAPLNQALAEARGWSAITLMLALPLFSLALHAARRGSLRGRLAWIGVLAYLVYSYLEFAVSPPFTPLYLVYIATFACAIPALVMGVASIDTEELAARFGERAPRRGIAAYALASAALLGLAWLKGILTQSFAGDFGWPTGVAAVGHVVHALDLGLQVPLAIAAGVLLIRRRPAGYVAAAVMLVNAVVMGTALVAMVAWPALAAGRSALEAAPFAVVPVVAAALAVAFFNAMRPPRARRFRAGPASRPGARTAA